MFTYAYASQTQEKSNQIIQAVLDGMLWLPDLHEYVEFNDLLEDEIRCQREFERIIAD